MKKKLLLVLGILYIMFAIIITIFLFKKNEYNVYETKNSYYICNSSITEYSDSSLVKFNKTDNIASMVDRKVYYFDKSNDIKKGKMESYNEKDNIFMIDDVPYEANHFIGLPSRSYILIGSAINFFTNKIAYLVCIIIPVVLLLVFEVYLLIRYIKRKKKGNKDEKDTK